MKNTEDFIIKAGSTLVYRFNQHEYKYETAKDAWSKTEEWILTKDGVMISPPQSWKSDTGQGAEVFLMLKL